MFLIYLICILVSMLIMLSVAGYFGEEFDFSTIMISLLIGIGWPITIPILLFLCLIYLSHSFGAWIYARKLKK